MISSLISDKHLFNCHITVTGLDLLAITETWLNGNGYKYHHLLMNKPRGGNYHWIDNHIVRATTYKGKWTPLVTKEMKIQVFE